MPFRIVPDFGKGSEYDVSSVRKDCCDVFQQDVSGSYFANGSEHLPPEAGPSAFFNPSLFSCVADILARESPCNDVNQSSIFFRPVRVVELFDITIHGCVIEVAVFDSGSDNVLTVWVDFDISNCTYLP